MTTRDNGLRASAYVGLIEIEEALGDRLLAALAERQIAAYVVPAAGPGGLPRLLLHVDAQRRIPAGAVLAGLTRADRAADGTADRTADRTAVEGAFAELVAGYHRTPSERAWPAAEDLPEDLPEEPQLERPTQLDRAAPPTPPAAPSPPVAPAATVLPAATAPPSKTPPPEDQDHYVPPTLPRLDPPSAPIRWALLGLGLGLALLLFPTLLTFDHTTSLDVVGVLLVLGSTGALLARLRDRSPDDPDDGAVV